MSSQNTFPDTDEEFAAFLAGEQKRLFYYALRLSEDPFLAEDLVQIAFFKFWEDRRSIRDMAAADTKSTFLDEAVALLTNRLRAWLRQVVANQVKDEAKRSAAKNVSLDETADAIMSPSASTEAVVEASITVDLYVSFLDHMSKSQETVKAQFQAICASLVRLQDLTYKEAADLVAEEFPELVEGYSKDSSARLSRVEAAVKRVDREFI